jgi:hypothetical protein
MANPTRTLIEAKTVATGGTSSIVFSSIPSTYTDLSLVYSARITAADTSWHLRINGSSSSIYSGRYLQGTGSNAYTGTWSAQNNDNFVPINGTGYTASTFTNVELYFPNYLSSDSKSYLVDSVTENAAAGAVMFLNSGLFASNSAISSLSLYYTGSSNDIAEFSTFYLYGIKNS